MGSICFRMLVIINKILIEITFKMSMAKFNLLGYRQLLIKNESLNTKDKDLFFEPDFIELLSYKRVYILKFFIIGKINTFI